MNRRCLLGAVAGVFVGGVFRRLAPVQAPSAGDETTLSALYWALGPSVTIVIVRTRWYEGDLLQVRAPDWEARQRWRERRAKSEP